jgi:hypothetical protein
MVTSSTPESGTPDTTTLDATGHTAADDDSAQDEALSETGSVTAEDLARLQPGNRYRDYVDLTADTVCRVLMTRVKDKVTYVCVCGMTQAQCTRPRHSAKRTDAQSVGAPAFYVALPGQRGAMDGLADRPTLTTGEAQRLRAQEEAEFVRARDDLTRMVDDEDTETGS